jgi:hypothetical protein
MSILRHASLLLRSYVRNSRENYENKENVREVLYRYPTRPKAASCGHGWNDSPKRVEPTPYIYMYLLAARLISNQVRYNTSSPSTVLW